MQKRRKIGILTFSYSSNSGSVLQAFALQKTISSIGNNEASIINYTKTNYGKPVFGENVFVKNIKQWTPKNIVKWTARVVAHPVQMKKFKKFYKKYYHNFSMFPYSREELSALNDQYDKFVVGSDQVWNYGSPQVDDTYFLDFVTDNRKKIAYAASFGQNHVPEEKRDHASTLISDFYSISVREPNGIDIVSDLTSKEARWVLDPSLLLDKSEYQQISTPPKEKGYVFVYTRHKSKKLDAFAEKLARTKGLSVIRVHKQWLRKSNSAIPKAIGPHEWLGYIENADYVVTNSFHGICFSIIFEKNFYVDLLVSTAQNTNSRMTGLLQQFHLTERCIDDVKNICELEKIDYSAVNEYKKQRQRESLAYLSNAIEGDEAG